MTWLDLAKRMWFSEHMLQLKNSAELWFLILLPRFKKPWIRTQCYRWALGCFFYSPYGREQ